MKHSVRQGRRVSIPTLGSTTLPTPPHVHQRGNSPNPVPLGFYGGFIKKAWLTKSLTVGE